MLKKVLAHSASFIAGGILLGGTTVALANSNLVQALKGSSTVYVNGKVVAQPPKLVYGGTTYVQLYSIQSGLINSGIPATWDGNNFNMTIPLQPPVPNGSSTVKIQDMKTLSIESHWQDCFVSTFEDNLGNVYNYGGITNPNDGPQPVGATMLLNGEYKSLTGTLVPSKEFANDDVDPDIGELKIYGDGKLLYDSGAVASDITSPIKVNVNLTGVTQVTVDLEAGDGQQSNGSIGFVNAVFSK